jgi:hypothetical protein
MGDGVVREDGKAKVLLKKFGENSIKRLDRLLGERSEPNMTAVRQYWKNKTVENFQNQIQQHF